MTDAQKLKRDPVTILHKAMTHLRKRWDGHKGMNGRENILILKQAIFRVDVQRCADSLTLWHFKRRGR